MKVGIVFNVSVCLSVCLSVCQQTKKCFWRRVSLRAAQCQHVVRLFPLSLQSLINHVATVGHADVNLGTYLAEMLKSGGQTGLETTSASAPFGLGLELFASASKFNSI